VRRGAAGRRTRMSSKSVAWSTFTNSVSKFLVSSSVDSLFFAVTWNLLYSITLARILEETFGSGIGASIPVSVERKKRRERVMLAAAARGQRRGGGGGGGGIA